MEKMVGIGKGLLFILLLLANSSVFAASSTQCNRLEKAKIACNIAVAAMMGDSSRGLNIERKRACKKYKKVKATSGCDATSLMRMYKPTRQPVSVAPALRAETRPSAIPRRAPPTTASTPKMPPALPWIIFGVFMIVVLRRPTVKGYLGELMLRLFTRLTLPKKTYKRLHNLTLPTADGTTQIDHVFVSPYGIFVVETKNMKGWIFGSEYQAQWTQKFRKSSYRFQNPLRQNYKHTKTIESLLDVPPETIHSVICFVGDSQFKTPMPPNVTHGLGSVRYIKTFKTRVFGDEEVRKVVEDLENVRYSATWKTHKMHVGNLRVEHGE